MSYYQTEGVGNNMEKVTEKSIAIEDLHPNVLHVGYQNMLKNAFIKKGIRSPERYSYDYEIEFFTDSSGITIVDGIEYKISKGSLVFRRPGQRCNSVTPYSCWFLVLDLLGNAGKNIHNFQITRSLSFQEVLRNPCLDSIPAFIKVQNESNYINCFSTINILAHSKDEHDRLALRIKLLELIYMICEDAKNSLSKKFIKQTERESTSIIFSILQYINTHYSEKMTLEDLSRRANLSPIYFHRLFTKVTQNTPAMYIQQVRLDRAKYMLLHTNMACSEIANACGFNSPSYFNYVFRKHFKLTPNEYRLNNLNTESASR